MNKFFSALLAVVMAFGLGTASFDAEAKRFGGGRSLGMQRQATPPKAPANNTAAAGAAGAAAKKNSWMGPIAGLAAGLGLAALASHLGFGEAFANMLMIALLVMAGLALFGFIMRKRAAQQGGMAYAGGGAGGGGASYGGGQTNVAREAVTPSATPSTGGSSIGSGLIGSAAAAPAIPADFDAQGFARQAKVNYIRLQAAHDAGDLDDIRSFTSPEMFAEIQMDIADRKGQSQVTEVLDLDAEVLAVAEESHQYVVSVRFQGQVREDGETSAVNEVWHLTKPRQGAGGWVVAGIEQMA